MRVVLTRALLLLAFWAILIEGDLAHLLPGIPIALLVSALGTSLFAPSGQTGIAMALMRTAPRLAWMSLVSGWDVAMRAFRPGPPLDPDIIEYRPRRPGEDIAIALSYAMSVLPGTLAVDVARDRIRVHVLDRRQPVVEALLDLERRLGGEAGR